MRAITWTLGFAALHRSAILPYSESLAPEPRHRRDVLRAAASLQLLSWGPTLSPSRALSPEEARAQYDGYAASYDRLDGGELSTWLGIDEARRSITGLASGDCLEVGVGTGLNLAYYDPAKVTSLTLVDVSKGMLRQALATASTIDNLRAIPVRALQADAASELVSLFGESSFDAVVDTFSLCVMGQDGAKACLDQMSRVAKRDGGRVLLLENSRSSSPILGFYQDVTADAAAGAGGKGCVYNQDVSRMVRETGRLEIVAEERYAAGLFRTYDCRRRSASQDMVT